LCKELIAVVTPVNNTSLLKLASSHMVPYGPEIPLSLSLPLSIINQKVIHLANELFGIMVVCQNCFQSWTLLHRSSTATSIHRLYSWLLTISGSELITDW